MSDTPAPLPAAQPFLSRANLALRQGVYTVYGQVCDLIPDDEVTTLVGMGILVAPNADGTFPDPPVTSTVSCCGRMT